MNEHTDKIRKFFVDCPSDINIKSDDFIICIGQKQSNSVYHVIESNKRFVRSKFRFTVKVFKSELIVCLKRSENQNIIPMSWNKR